MTIGSAFTFGGTDACPSRLRRLAGISIGLVYLCFPVLEIVTGEVTGAAAFWGAAGLLAFVVCYLATVLSPRGFGDPTRLTYWLLGVTTLLGVGLALAVFGGGWTTLPIYLTVVYSMALRPRLSVAGIVAMALAVLLIGLLRGGRPRHHPGARLPGRHARRPVHGRAQHPAAGDAAPPGTGGGLARLAASEERLRIARDLHDLLGHSLSLIVLKSELAGRLAENGSERAVAEIRDIESVARQALVEVRDAVTGYRQRGLSGELDGARAALEAAGTRVTIRLAGTPLPGPLDELLGWAVREGVTNVVRHARATRCEIAVTADGEAAALDIVDDGCGAVRYEPGSGLTGLTERVRAAGGRSPPGRARPASPSGSRSRSRGVATVPAASRGPGPAEPGTGSAAAAGVSPRGRCSMIRVLLAEDQAMVRGALATLLGLRTTSRWWRRPPGRRGGGHGAGDPPDVALLDIEMPGGDGLVAAARAGRAGARRRVRDPDHLRPPGLPAPGDGGGRRRASWSRTRRPRQLADAVRRAAAGERVVDPALAVAALSRGRQPADGPRARRAAAAASGRPYRTSPRRLHLSEGTVRNYLSMAIQKTHARNRTEAAERARTQGWL